jgi:hypothetical protein
MKSTRNSKVFSGSHSRQYSGKQKRADAIPNLLYQALCNNKPIELSNAEMAWQKLDYLHFNSVKAGFTSEPGEYWYSSARDYAGKKGLLKIWFL